MYCKHQARTNPPLRNRVVAMCCHKVGAGAGVPPHIELNHYCPAFDLRYISIRPSDRILLEAEALSAKRRLFHRPPRTRVATGTLDFVSAVELDARRHRTDYAHPLVLQVCTKN